MCPTPAPRCFASHPNGRLFRCLPLTQAEWIFEAHLKTSASSQNAASAAVLLSAPDSDPSMFLLRSHVWLLSAQRGTFCEAYQGRQIVYVESCSKVPESFWRCLGRVSRDRQKAIRALTIFFASTDSSFVPSFGTGNAWWQFGELRG